MTPNKWREKARELLTELEYRSGAKLCFNEDYAALIATALERVAREEYARGFEKGLVEQWRANFTGPERSGTASCVPEPQVSVKAAGEADVREGPEFGFSTSPPPPDPRDSLIAALRAECEAAWGAVTMGERYLDEYEAARAARLKLEGK